jgi:3-oxoacyl-[acyl-carrier-protein] synthase III
MILGKSKLESFGKYLPERVFTNFDMEKIVETSNEWIKARTGIEERRVATDKETLSYMASEALKNACSKINMPCEDIEYLFVASCTYDKLFPSVAQETLKHLKIKDRPALDVGAACSGFTYGLHLADSLIRIGQYKKIAVIGVEKFSKFLNWADRGTCILFGDGAGACIVSRDEKGESEILTSCLGGDSINGDVITCEAGLLNGPSILELADGTKRSEEKQADEDKKFVTMEGQEVFKYAVRIIPKTVKKILKMADLSIDQIGMIIPHQANIRIIERAAKFLKLPMDKFYLNLRRYGNTSAASIPIAFEEALAENRIKRGDYVITIGFGAGLTYGANVIKF